MYKNRDCRVQQPESGARATAAGLFTLCERAEVDIWAKCSLSTAHESSYCKSVQVCGTAKRNADLSGFLHAMAVFNTQSWICKKSYERLK